MVVHMDLNKSYLVFKRYLSKPEKFWGEDTNRNAKKIKHKIKSLLEQDEAQDHFGEEELAEFIWALATVRSRMDGKHFYIANIGSSGSHWLEKMLSYGKNIAGGGEIYIPVRIRRHLERLGQREAGILLDAIYLSHLGRIDSESTRCIIINSAHYADRNIVVKYSGLFKSLLLIRDPIDIALSRTFRKTEYRNYIDPGSTDEQYLEKNCKIIIKFYEQALREKYDLMVKYEELVLRTREQLRSIKNSLNLEMSDEAIEQAILSTSREANKRDSESNPENSILNDWQKYGSTSMKKAYNYLSGLRLSLGYPEAHFPSSEGREHEK